MRVNPDIKRLLGEISKETIVHTNTTQTVSRRYTLRMLRLFKTQLTEEEQIYVLQYLLQNLHYKNIALDPDTIMLIHNLKLRNVVTYTITMFMLLIVGVAIMFDNSLVSVVIEGISNVFKLLSIGKD